MTPTEAAPSFEILLVEDNPGDVRLTREALRMSKAMAKLNTVSDGIEAMAYLRKQGSKGKIFVFLGAKGGVGTSTVAINIASGIAWAKRSVVAVELRATFGTFSAQLGSTPARNLGNLLQVAAERINEVEGASRLIELPSSLKVLSVLRRQRNFERSSPKRPRFCSIRSRTWRTMS